MKRNQLPDYLHCITHLSGDTNYTYVHFCDRPSVLFSNTLAMCAAELPGFVRIHRKYAVNPAFVTAALLTGHQTELIVNGTSLPVSRRQVSLVRKALTNVVPFLPAPPAPVEWVPIVVIPADAHRSYSLTWR